MYRNISKKIKNLAKYIFIFAAALSLLGGCYLMTIGGTTAVIGVIIMVAVPVLAWVIYRFLYNFGNLIEKMCDIEENTIGANEVSQDFE